MAVRIENQAEPIPGYKLIERLGGGGFGEVWKAEAPGGLYKAIKFVFGDLRAADGQDDSRAKQEFKALSRVKSVHHPYILSLERFDIIDGQLIIVMELADRTMWDRFRECRNQGLQGIPRDELLGYMHETAEALDLMNDQYKLQHLDIKPQNLFLVFNHVKVADFGLVKDLEGMAATITGGVTPVYAAPETFDGWLSRSSDQYSLAIVYEEMLTGKRPFAGTTVRQLVLQHMQADPDLSPLAPEERPIVERALSKNPDHRFPSCLDFIKALRSIQPSVNVSAQMDDKISGPLPSSAPSGGLSGLASSVLALEVTRVARGKALPAQPRVPAKPNTNKTVPSLSALPPRPPRETKVVPPVDTNTNNSVPVPAVPASAAPVAENGILQPALIIGVGQMGLGVLQKLRKEIAEQFGTPKNLAHVRLVYLDTDPDAIQAAMNPGPEGLQPSETFLTRLHRPSHYLKPRDGKLPYDGWLDSKVLYRIPKQLTYAGVRPLGRLALVDNSKAIMQRLEGELAACCDAECLEDAARYTGLPLRTPAPRVYIVTSLTGGTGSGMFIDLAYMARKMLKQMGHACAEVVGLFLLPPAKADGGNATALAHTVAALTELNHFASSDAVFIGRYEAHASTKSVHESGPAFQRSVFLTLPESGPGRKANPDETLTPAGHFLFNDLFTAQGAEADNLRRRRADLRQAGTTFQTFGIFRIIWPRRQLLQQVAHRLSSRLVQHWMNKDVSAVQQEVKEWVGKQWEECGFRPEALIARYQEECGKALGGPPETLLAAILDPLAKTLSKVTDVESMMAAVSPELEKLDNLFGIPEEFRPADKAGNVAPMEKTLMDCAGNMARSSGEKLAELVVRLFEQPAFRLAGAEEAIRQFTELVQTSLSNQESLSRELEERSVAMYQRLLSLQKNPAQIPVPPPPRWSPFGRRTSQLAGPIAELLDLLRSYAKARYQGLVLRALNDLYLSVRGHLSDQMREINFCRQRLGELADLVNERLTRTPASAPLGNLVLLPSGCSDLETAISQVDDSVTAENVIDFDNQIQELLVENHRALVQVCMAPSEVIRELSSEMVAEAVKFLEPRLKGASVAEMFMARYTNDAAGRQQLEDDLLAAYDEAATDFNPRSSEEECFITVPGGNAGRQLRGLCEKLFPEAHVVETENGNEILFFRALQGFSVSDLQQFGPAGQEAYQRLGQEPSLLHSRTDITEWRTAVAAC